MIAPGIRDARHNGRQLEPYPVNARTISDSIITEILTGIADSRLVFADISTMAKDQDKAFRNGNVMYEVGIAHAVRLPEEVILFRSDRDALLFDTSDVRVNEYDPDADPDKARATVTGAVESALREIDLRRHLAVRKAVESLDAYTYCTLLAMRTNHGLHHPNLDQTGQILGNLNAVAAISRLLEIGAARVAHTFTPTAQLQERTIREAMRYECSELGVAILDEIFRRVRPA